MWVRCTTTVLIETNNDWAMRGLLNPSAKTGRPNLERGGNSSLGGGRDAQPRSGGVNTTVDTVAVVARPYSEATRTATGVSGRRAVRAAPAGRRRR
jgi:hypothetical protein